MNLQYQCWFTSKNNHSIFKAKKGQNQVQILIKKEIGEDGLTNMNIYNEN